MAKKTAKAIRTDFYFDLFNQECHAPSIVGRKLTQDEVDKVVALCSEDNDCWGEEHLLEVLTEFKHTL